MWGKKHLRSFLWLWKKNRSVMCVYFGFWQSHFYFSISDKPPNFLGFMRQRWRAITRPNRTGPEQLLAVTATLAPSTVLCVRFCRLVVVFVLPFLFTTEWHSCSKALLSKRLSGGRRGLASWIDRGSIVSLSQNRLLFFMVVEWTTSDRWSLQGGAWWKGVSSPSATATPPSRQSSRVYCRLYAICFAHCVHIYIDVRHIFLYTCTTDGISIL